MTVADGQDNPSEVGRRFEEQKPGTDSPHQDDGGSTAYLRTALEGILKRAGNPGPGPTATTLAVTLEDLYLEEKTYVNAEFSGGVALEVGRQRGELFSPAGRELTGQGRTTARSGTRKLSADSESGPRERRLQRAPPEGSGGALREVRSSLNLACGQPECRILRHPILAFRT